MAELDTGTSDIFIPHDHAKSLGVSIHVEEGSFELLNGSIVPAV